MSPTPEQVQAAREWLNTAPRPLHGHSWTARGDCDACVNDLAVLLAEREAAVYRRGFEAAREEAIQWAMAERRDDGTAQRIEEHIRALAPDKEQA